MRFTNEITSSRPPAELFGALTDMERIAPCLPGAAIEGREGDDYLGTMRVRVGPVSATYRGHLRLAEVDEAERRAVIKARADELNGNGSAEASIALSVSPADDGSVVRVETDLQIRGRLAQFGRGAIGPIATRMLNEFGSNLERLLGSGGTGTPTPRPEAAALDVTSLSRLPEWRRLLPLAAAL